MYCKLLVLIINKSTSWFIKKKRSDIHHCGNFALRFSNYEKPFLKKKKNIELLLTMNGIQGFILLVYGRQSCKICWLTNERHLCSYQ